MNLTEIALLMDPTVDAETVRPCKEHLDRFGLHCETKTFSPLTDTDSVFDYIRKAPERGVKLFIVGASIGSKMAAIVASQTYLPVIAIPIVSDGATVAEALIATAQMSEGVPVATMAVGATGAKNAAVMAAQILSLSDHHLHDRLKFFKQNGCRFS